MPIEPKEALEFIGVDPEKVENLEAFKESFSKTYIPRDKVQDDNELTGRIFGRINGELRSKLKSGGKELGVDAKWDDLDPTEGIKHLVISAKTSIASLQNELAEAKKSKAPAAEIKEIQDALTAEKNEKAKLVEKLTEWENKYNNEVNSRKAEKEQKEEDEYWQAALREAGLPKDLDELVRVGFEAEARKRYKNKRLESGGFETVDPISGQKFENPKRAHAHYTLGELLKNLATEKKLIGGNAPLKVKTTASLVGGSQPTEKTPEQRGRERRVMPSVHGAR